MDTSKRIPKFETTKEEKILATKTEEDRAYALNRRLENESRRLKRELVNEVNDEMCNCGIIGLYNRNNFKADRLTHFESLKYGTDGNNFKVGDGKNETLNKIGYFLDQYVIYNPVKFYQILLEFLETERSFFYSIGFTLAENICNVYQNLENPPKYNEFKTLLGKTACLYFDGNKYIIPRQE